MIGKIHEAPTGCLGCTPNSSPAGCRVGRKRVARLMRESGWAGVSRRRGTRTIRFAARKLACVDRSHRAAPDRVERQFAADAPDRIWVADITYVPTWTGFLYLAIVLDVFSRKVVGWAMANHLRTELVLAALNMAIAQRPSDHLTNMRASRARSTLRSPSASGAGRWWCLSLKSVARVPIDIRTKTDIVIGAFGVLTNRLLSRAVSLLVEFHSGLEGLPSLLCPRCAAFALSASASARSHPVSTSPPQPSARSPNAPPR